MSKVITSPVKRFPGTVTLSDPLTFPQAIAFEDGLAAVRSDQEAGSITKVRFAILPGVLACVEAWRLGNFPESPSVDSFPSTPRQSVAELIDWLVGEVSALYQESEEVPLA